jgi:hypothetical protein
MVEDVVAEVTGHSIEIATAAFAEAQGEIDKGKEYGVSIL